MSDIGSLGLDSTLRYFMQGTKYCHSTVAGELDLFIVLRSRMSGIGSLGLDSTLRYFMPGTKYCHR